MRLTGAAPVHSLDGMGRRNAHWRRVVGSALAGAAAALAMLLGLASLVHLGSPALPGATNAKTNRQLSNGMPLKVASRLKFLPPLPKPPEVAKPKPETPEELLNGQVVETARPEREQAPKNAKYLGRYDMTVAKETKATGRKAQGRDLGRVAIANPSSLQSPQSSSRDPTQLPQQAARATKSSGGPAQPAVEAQLGPGIGPAPQPERQAGQSGSVVVRGADNGLLLPSTSPGNVLRNLQALSGAPGSNDYLPDVDDEGDTNLLNTRKFRYWDYFQRVKDRVSQEWEPGRIWRERDPTGQRYGVKNRLTIVRVTLDPEGALKQLRVAKESGLEFLDDEARRAFAAASPFPNPPAGLRNDRGEIEFQFGFLFEISTQRFKMRGWQ